MMWNIFCEKKNEIYRCFIALLIYGALICLSYSFWGIEKIEPLVAGLIALIFIYVVCLFELSIIGKAILCSVTVSFGFVKILLLEKEELIELIKGFIPWFYEPMIETEHFKLYMGIVILIVAIICYIIGFLCQKIKIFKYLVFLIGVITSIYLMIRQVEVSKPGIAFLFSFLMVVIVEWLEARWKKNSDSDKRLLYMVCLWPVWIIFIIVMCFAPSSNKPYDWHFVRVLNENVEDVADAVSLYFGIGNRNDFSVGMGGFSENTQLGGNIENNNKVLLKVDARTEMPTNIYLTGAISNSFDGRQWSGQYDEGSRDRKLDTLETLYAVWKYDHDGEHNYVERASITIEYKDFDSFYYFIPNKCHSLVVNGYNINSFQGDANRAWQKRKREGDKYVADYYQINLDHDIFYEMIEESSYEDEEIWNKVCANLANEKVEYADLIEYQKKQKEQYAIDVKLSDRMQQWIYEVTYGCNSDLERLRAIEKALSSLTYTISPGRIPLSVDSPSEFLDYFVLDKKEGYCTYFATAFTLLARAEGFPARYIQGFSVPIKGHKSVYVTGNMAHAWPEVYFEGVGWIPFEPTPGYSDIRYTPWEVEEEKIVEATDYEGAATSGAGRSMPDEEDGEDDDEEEEEIEEIEDEGLNIDFDVIIWGFIMALAMSIIILFIHVMICRYLYDKMSLDERYRWEIERCIKVLSKLGISKADEETLSDLQRTMEDKYKSWEESVPDFISEYEQVIYGTKPVTSNMIDNVIKTRSNIKKRLRVRARLLEEFRDYRKK